MGFYKNTGSGIYVDINAANDRISTMYKDGNFTTSRYIVEGYEYLCSLTCIYLDSAIHEVRELVDKYYDMNSIFGIIEYRFDNDGIFEIEFDSEDNLIKFIDIITSKMV